MQILDNLIWDSFFRKKSHQKIDIEDTSIVTHPGLGFAVGRLSEHAQNTQSRRVLNMLYVAGCSKRNVEMLN